MDPAKPYTGEASCWTEDREAAAAYQDNQGFGGPALYMAEIDLDGVLDLTKERDGIEALAEIVAEERGEDAYDLADEWRGKYAWEHEVLEEETGVRAVLRERGWQWVRFCDSYPENAITLMRLATSPVAVEEVKE
jgi:hypothetical protein